MPALVLQGMGTRTPTTLFLRRPLVIVGVTKGPTGAVLGNCVVRLFRTETDGKVDREVSDPATGAYTVHANDTATYYVVATTLFTADNTLLTVDQSTPTADTTMLEGVTVNTLVGV